MPDATHYTYRVEWSAEDAEYVATVAEFSSLSWVASTPVEALEGLVGVVRDVLGDLAAVGAPASGPLSESEHLDAVLALVHELCKSGHEPDFREKLWCRLRDEALLDRDDLAQSLDQMAVGEVVPAVLLEEEDRHGEDT